MADRRVKMKSRSLERGKSAPLIVVTQNEDGSKKDPLVSGLKMGHEFKKRTFYKPTYCHHCSELLWGLMNQGYQCSVCSYVSHEKCIPYIMVNCLHLKAEMIIEQSPHHWTGPDDKNKKKWCNICRKRIQGPVYYCSVCRIQSHDRCRNEAFNDCKRCALYSRISNPKLSHHWVEGNLPSAAKCEVCLKSCTTDLCLSGFKCGWCGITVHSNCLDTFLINPRNERCTFRDLRFMILPPTAVSLPMKELDSGEEVTIEDIPQLFSPVTSDDRILEVPADGEDRITAEDTDRESKGRPAVIIDGIGGSQGYKKWRKRTLQSIYIPRRMLAEEVLFISLRKFGISANMDEFYLCEVVDTSTGDERVVMPEEMPFNLQQTSPGPLKLYIKKKSVTKVDGRVQKLKIYNSNLPATAPFVESVIDDKLTFADIIVKCIQLFELEDKSMDNYCVYESAPDSGEQLVNIADKPLKRIEDITKDSLRSYSSLRYYLSPKEKIVIELYLWKVPIDSLKTKDDAAIFVKNLAQDISFEIGPLFPNHGGLVLEVGSVQDAIKVTTSYQHVKQIPKIHNDRLQVNQEPLLVFVNTKSGGKQGVKLMSGFKRHVNPHQVYDLLNGGPIPGFYSFRNVARYRILVAGGDGTVGWVLGALDDMKDILHQPSPPCGVIPLGTGNDLARALKWGGGYSGEKVMQLLYSVEDANVVDFDRWIIDMSDPLDGLVDSDMSASKQIVMNNYFGIGLDAEIALDFHHAREEHPEKFNSRFHNKGVYLQLGVQKTFSRDPTTDLSSVVTLEVEGTQLNLPSGLKGIVVLNIASWGAGSEPWGSAVDEEFQKCSFDDGKIEVLGLSGPVHLGQIKSGIRGGIRIAQCSEVCFSFNNSLPVQVDGEAWTQTGPVKISIKKLESTTRMLMKSNQEFYSRGLTQGQAKTLVGKQTIVGQETAQFSSRRPRVLNSLHSQPTMGVSSHTLYIKDKEPSAD